MKLSIDPGHGRGTGCHGPGGFLEDDWTLDFGNQLSRWLTQYRPSVAWMMTRTRDDEHPSLDERADMARAFGADLALALHVNATQDPREHGPLAFRLFGVPYVSVLCDVWTKALESLGGEYVWEDRAWPMKTHHIIARPLDTHWTHRAFNVLAPYHTLPAICLEFGYASNLDELRDLTSDDGAARYLGATVAAIDVMADLLKQESETPAT